MLTQYHLPVSLCFLSTDLPILATIETAATLYKKDTDKYHLLFNADIVPEVDSQLLWLELSPYRVIMTVQGNNKLNYRHFWEKGVYGSSRYWLNEPETTVNSCLHLRNYTRDLEMTGSYLPERLRLEYELWSNKVSLGHYVLHLEIDY